MRWNAHVCTCVRARPVTIALEMGLFASPPRIIDCHVVQASRELLRARADAVAGADRARRHWLSINEQRDFIVPVDCKVVGASAVDVDLSSPPRKKRAGVAGSDEGRLPQKSFFGGEVNGLRKGDHFVIALPKPTH